VYLYLSHKLHFVHYLKWKVEVGSSRASKIT
jgi:hypothetical protein